MGSAHEMTQYAIAVGGFSHVLVNQNALDSLPAHSSGSS
jgi:hypothetical protein